MTATNVLKKIGLIPQDKSELMIKKGTQEWSVGDLMSKYADYRVLLHIKKQELIEQFTSRLNYIGFDRQEFEFVGIPTNDYITIRLGYWKPMDSDVLLRLQQLSGLEHKITEEYSEEDDGDDDDGKPMMIKRWCYNVRIDVSQF